MTGFGMFQRQTSHMLNIELARIIQAEREREIAAELRNRRLLRPEESDRAEPKQGRRLALHRPASSGATTR